MANLKVNMSMTKNEMPEQDPVVRAGNFDEVALGYDPETAMQEAARCLDCKNSPCRTGCPVAVKIPRFLEKVREGDFDAAYEIITSTNSLPAVCGRVCPQEKQCESKCVRGIKGESVGIGRLERFVADYHMAKENLPDPVAPASNGHRVAVIGSGPAGLTCAGDLRKLGYDVTIFEAFHKSGGVLVYGIPQFRLPKEIVAAEIENLTKMGVKIVNNAIIGKSITVDELFEDGFEAVFIGSGAGLPQFLHIPGENLLGVYSANELLTRTNLMKAYRDDYDTPIKKFNRVAVVGAGNVAMDAARVAKRLGAEHVYIVYRRGADELPARKEEVEHAEAEGIEFKLLNNPCAIHGDENGHVTGIELHPSGAGRARREGPPQARCREGLQLGPGRGHRHHRHRHQPQPADPQHHRRTELHQEGRHRGRRGRPHLPRGRVRRRRRGHRLRHGHPRHGRGQGRREEHRRVYQEQGLIRLQNSALQSRARADRTRLTRAKPRLVGARARTARLRVFLSVYRAKLR